MTITALSDVDPCEAKFAQVAEVLEAAHSVTILCHVQPDADTIGSGLALGLVLEHRGVSVQVAFSRPSALPESMRDFPGLHLLVAPTDVRESVDVLVTVDVGSEGRLGVLASRLAGANRTIVLDHHRSNSEFGSINVV
ncbi:DHH family phosphoesterase, partial [Rhodococcus sp. (in: high G+C Gram-positive bacteria)]|uniref:DHH family phosphoesterase n=1 Tax=Rhodococcus sp. TaxID=1831 RepID=UPI00257C199F